MALFPWRLLRIFQVRMLPFNVVTLIARKGIQQTSFAEWLLMKLISLHYSMLIHSLRNKFWWFLALNSLHIQRWPWSSDLPSAEITGPCHHTWFGQCWGPNSGPCMCKTSILATEPHPQLSFHSLRACGENLSHWPTPNLHCDELTSCEGHTISLPQQELDLTSCFDHLLLSLPVEL